MPRRPRAFLRGQIFHVVNRGATRQRLFFESSDYRAFLRIVAAARAVHPVQLFAYCVMPNHWHLITGVRNPRQLSSFMHLMTTTHSRRWALSHGVASEGAVYQGRFTAVPVQSDHHFLHVCRYVERNPLRAKLVARAEEWPWSSMCANFGEPWLEMSTWPMERPAGWCELVNLPQSDVEVEEIRESLRREQPLGEATWRKEMIGPRRSRGRPGAPATRISSARGDRGGK
jgi:putative transposase